MPVVSFDALPDSARVWVFGAANQVTGAAAESLLATVDAHLTTWRAHGAPLVCARDWKDHRFLVVGVDEAATGATGCSIDGLFHVLRDLESVVGTTLVGGGTVYWRDAEGAVVSGPAQHSARRPLVVRWRRPHRCLTPRSLRLVRIARRLRARRPTAGMRSCCPWGDARLSAKTHPAVPRQMRGR